MPHSVPVSELMIPRNEWPQILGDADVCSAIKILRIVTEDRKLEHGHSTPLVVDEYFNLLGFVHLTDLLKSVKHLWQKEAKPCETEGQLPRIKELVVQFAGTVGPGDSILKALDIMMEHTVSMVPVMENGKLEGIIKLSDIFNTVAALLFGETDPDQKHQLLRDFHA
jgi:CBS domain-containing protein